MPYSQQTHSQDQAIGYLLMRKTGAMRVSMAPTVVRMVKTVITIIVMTVTRVLVWMAGMVVVTGMTVTMLCCCWWW